MIEKSWQRVQLRFESQPVKRRLYVCCSYSETGTITVFKSVARIRLMKTENPKVCVTVNCDV
jgi:hypothetical protein